MDLDEHILIMIKDISTSQEPPASYKPPAMPSIFETVLDALKLTNFNQILNIASSWHQRHHTQSGVSLILIPHQLQQQLQLNLFQPNLKQSFLKPYWFGLTISWCKGNLRRVGVLIGWVMVKISLSKA